MSSISRRQLARRRSGRPWGWRPLLLVALVVAICLAAFLAGRGGL